VAKAVLELHQVLLVQAHTMPVVAVAVLMIQQLLL
jgi:hypothetical protein